MHRLPLLALLLLLALPAAAVAAPAKISPRPVALSAAGTATIEAANPNAYVLRGKASVLVDRRAVASKAVKLGTWSVTQIAVRFDAKALEAVRAAGGRVTVVLELRRANGRRTTARRALTLTGAAAPMPSPGADPAGPGAPTGQPQDAPAGDGGQPGGGTGTGTGTGSGTGTGTGGGGSPVQETPPSNRWTGRMGSEGAYDDLTFTLTNGTLEFTKPPFVPVVCFEVGGSGRTAVSLEPFVLAGPWTMGTESTVAQMGIAGNQLVGSSARTIHYTVKNTAQRTGSVTGTLGMSFSDSKYDVFTNRIIFINCAGTQSFEAIPAP